MNIRTIASTILLAAIGCLSSCNKEPIPSPSEDPVLFTRTIRLKDASGERELALHFKALSQETLDQINPAEYRVKPIFEAPSPTEQTTVERDSDIDPFPNELLSSPSMEQAIAIDVDIVQAQGDELGFLLEVKKEASAVGELEARSCFNIRWLTASWARRARVKNYSSNPLYARFYYRGPYSNSNCPYVYPTGCIDQLAVKKKLYKNGVWIYGNCSKQVGVSVDPGCRSYHFSWYIYSNCH